MDKPMPPDPRTVPIELKHTKAIKEMSFTSLNFINLYHVIAGGIYMIHSIHVDAYKVIQVEQMMNIVT